MQKRTNPFATPIVKNEDEQPKIVQQKPIIEEEIYEEPVYEAPKPTRVVKKQTYQPVRRTEKEKMRIWAEKKWRWKNIANGFKFNVCLWKQITSKSAQ